MNFLKGENLDFITPKVRTNLWQESKLESATWQIEVENRQPCITREGFIGCLCVTEVYLGISGRCLSFRSFVYIIANSCLKRVFSSFSFHIALTLVSLSSQSPFATCSPPCCWLMCRNSIWPLPHRIITLTKSHFYWC